MSTRDIVLKKFPIGKHLPCRGGWIWNLPNNKIIKVIEDNVDGFEIKFIGMMSNLFNLNSNAIVKIYEYGLFVCNGRKLCYYIVKKLNSLPIDYNTEFDNLIRAEYYKRKKPFGFSTKIQHNKKSVELQINKFIDEISSFEYKYYDLHNDNFMLDKSDNLLKLIDLESFLIS